MNHEVAKKNNLDAVVKETKRSYGDKYKLYGDKSDPFDCVVIPKTNTYQHDRRESDVTTFLNPLAKTYERGERYFLNICQCIGYAMMFFSFVGICASSFLSLSAYVSFVLSCVVCTIPGAVRASDRLVEPNEIVVPLESVKKGRSGYRISDYDEENTILAPLDPVNKALFIDTLNANHSHLRELVENQNFMKLFEPANNSFGCGPAASIASIRREAKVAHKETEAETLIRHIVVRPYDIDYLDEQFDEVNKKLREVCNTFIHLAKEEQRSEEIVKSAQKRLPKVIREEIANDLNTMVDTQLGELCQLAKARELANNELAEKLSLVAK